MNEKLINKIYHEKEEKIPNTIIYNLSTYLNEWYKYKKFCIVEGSLDRYFYSNLKRYDLKNNTRYLFNNKNDNEVGKDSVISSFNIINNNDDLKKHQKKIIYIVDHDYDGVKSEKYYIDSEDEKKFTITKPYSYENYFLTSDNIKKIFKYYGLSEEESNKFENIYSTFSKEIREYTRLKSSTIEIKRKNSIYYDEYCPPYRKRHEYKDIFDFKFEGNKCLYNRTKLYEEIGNMKNFVIQNKKAQEYYTKCSYKLVENNDYVRGHNAFDFLCYYLKDIHNINLSDYPPNDNYSKIVSILDVDIVIKNGLGEVI